MFDYHLHSSISFDSTCPAADMVKAAERQQLKEICFTDHWDYNSEPNEPPTLFDLGDYSTAYDSLQSSELLIRRGVEFGMTAWDTAELTALLQKRRFDFVIGSVHSVDGYDPYDKEFWDGKTVRGAYTRYLEEILRCVKTHSDFDVLGHLTYVCRSSHNPSSEPLLYADYRELCDAIIKELIAKGKGMEINTSGVNQRGILLPTADIMRRFRELGGEIVTVGSDAHTADRVGQHIDKALEMAKEVFGYVCTFCDRKPIFHRL